MTAIGRALAFYNYGRKHFNRKGWVKAERLDTDIDLQGRVYLVTGSNSGIGKCLAEHLFSKGARVYMLCRSEDRAVKAREEIVAAHGDREGDHLRILVGDCSVQADVERAIAELGEKETVLDCLVCNAGALLDKRTLTADGVETTFACHFLYGTYWLSRTALPMLQRSTDPRIVVVTSGGMYNSKLCPLEETIQATGKFDGQMAYAKAKRAQVALTERWGSELGKVKVVATHPGWTGTPGVDKVYGSISQWFLSPLRSLWEGTEGMAWLCAAPGDQLKSGELYLDGHIEPKHLHKSTNSTPEEVEAFFKDLEAYTKSHSSSSEEAASADPAPLATE